MSLRIGIDATCWWNRRGFGRFTRQLLISMFGQGRGHEFVLFTDRAPAPEMRQANVQIVHVPTRRTVTESAVADGARSLGDILLFRRAVASEPLSIMYFPAVYSWFPTGGRAPVVITFHDAIAEHFPALVFPTLPNRLLWNAKTWAAKRSAAAITTISNTARDELARYLHVDGERIHVILEAADPRFRPLSDPGQRAAMRARLGLAPGARLLVYVGGMAPHKNLMRLLDAFALTLAHQSAGDIQLVLAGDPQGDGFHSNYPELHARAEIDPLLRGKVHFTGFISDDDLVALYSDAWVVALPSLSEGFGLPAAEAIACGAPVIAAQGGAVAEIVGDAGAFFDPYDVGDIARTIQELASRPERVAALQAACRPRAAALSWDCTAAGMLDVLETYAARR